MASLSYPHDLTGQRVVTARCALDFDAVLVVVAVVCAWDFDASPSVGFAGECSCGERDPARAERCAVMVGGACEDAVGGRVCACAEVEPDEFAVLHAAIQRRQFGCCAGQQVAVGVGGDGRCGDEEGVNTAWLYK